MTRDYTSIGNWCIDAHGITAPELPDSIAKLQLTAIVRHAGKASIIQIAKDLAEGLNDLPTSQRLAAQETLRSKHGFGFDYFIQREQVRLAKILARGKIRDEAEYRAVLDALSDTTLDSSLALQLERLLTSHESESGAGQQCIQAEPASRLGLTQALGLMSNEPTAKVLFRATDDDGGVTIETLWAVPLGNDLYKLDNSPFYAYGVSWQDTVYAPVSPEEQMATFQSVVERAGNRTVRIIFDPPVSPSNSSDQVLQGLVSLGCSYEGANPKYISVNIPPAVDLQHVRSYLISHDAQWEHADPTFESLFPDEA